VGINVRLVLERNVIFIKLCLHCKRKCGVAILIETFRLGYVCPQKKFNRIQAQALHFNNRKLLEELQAMAGLLEQVCICRRPVTRLGVTCTKG